MLNYHAVQRSGIELQTTMRMELDLDLQTVAESLGFLMISMYISRHVKRKNLLSH